MSEAINHDRRRFFGTVTMTIAAATVGMIGSAAQQTTRAAVQLPVEGELPSLGGAVSDRRRFYAVPARLRLNQWALSGDWTVGKQATILKKANGRIAYRFHARDLHLVMGPAARGTAVRFRVLIDGQPPGAAHGVDVDDKGNGTLSEQRLYQLIRQPQPSADRQFEIEFLAAGVEAFAFTFG